VEDLVIGGHERDPTRGFDEEAKGGVAHNGTVGGCFYNTTNPHEVLYEVVE